jgi:hypothetical protein
MVLIIDELIKRWLKPREPRISKDDATQIARQLCAENGWQWLEPIGVRSRIGTWIVRTNDGWRGSCAFIKISKTIGEIISAQYYPR